MQGPLVTVSIVENNLPLISSLRCVISVKRSALEALSFLLESLLDAIHQGIKAEKMNQFVQH